jgi:ADP-ribose pyrophosphatase YjhB (NUDIX family)
VPDHLFNYCPACGTALAERLIAGVRRAACPACEFVVFADPKVVAVVVVEHAGQVLLGRRSINPGMGQWSFVAGYVNRGEKVEDTALREVKEETNLAVRLDGLLGVYSATGRSHILIAYRANVTPDALRALTPQLEEVSDLAFFGPDEMPPLAFPGDYEIFAAWQQAAAERPAATTRPNEAPGLLSDSR